MSVAQALAQRIEALEAENAYLRGELGLSISLTNLWRLRRALGLSGIEATILLTHHAARGRVMSKIAIHEAFDANREGDKAIKIVDVMVCRIRKALGPDVIETAWGHGYALTEHGLLLVGRALAVANA